MGLRSEDRYDGGLDGDAGDECIGLGEIDVHLAPDAEFARQVDARLDREARVREQAPPVLGLEIVDVGAIAVDFFTDRVPGTVDEPVFIPRLPDHAAAQDRKSTRLNSSHLVISYAVFCLKKKKKIVR